MMDYRYNGKIETDIDKKVLIPTVVLCTRSGRKIGVINNIQSFKCNHPLSDVSELSFDVYKEVNGIKNIYWDFIKDFKFIFLPTVKDPRFRWYEITVNIDEGNDTIKHITGVHANEAELGQLMLYDVEINTENDIARDDYELITIGEKEYGTVFYNPEHPKASLLHRLLSDKASHYSVIHVDETLKNIQREFSFNGTSIADALRQNVAQEIGCLFIFGESSGDTDDNIFHRTISAYDLMDYCEDCGERGNYTQGVCTNCGSTKIKGGYGKDTGIFINAENLTDSISFTSNTDQVKNFFKMGAGDEYMEAAIRNCNPNGSNYLSYFSDEMKEDMSDELVAKLNEYETIYDSYLKDNSIYLPTEHIDEYNTLVNKYQTYIKEDIPIINYTIKGYTELTNYDYSAVNFKDCLQTTMMPASEEVVETTANEQIAKLTVESMSPIGTEDSSALSLTAANTAVESYSKVYVDSSRYKIEISDSTYINSIWTGIITVTSLTDEEDTANKQLTITFNNDGAQFLKQKIQKMMEEHKIEDIGDVSFLQEDYTDAQLQSVFKPKLKKYSLDALSLLDDLCTATMDILADANQGTENSQYYEDFYHPYWKKRKLIMEEESVREEEIRTVEQIIEDIDTVRSDIIETLDMPNFFGDELYSELMLYRRETEYSNSNFISDGLTDSEVIEKAQEYFKRAQKEIIKASTIQHSISCSLYNLFLIPEFRKILLTNDENHIQYIGEGLYVDGNGEVHNIDDSPAIVSTVKRFINLFNDGNWLRVRVDDKVYKLRLINWEIDYEKPEELEVEFSDVIFSGDTMSDISSLLSQARTMASSYDAVMRQAEKGNQANQTINRQRKQGLILNQNKIINDIDTQSFILNSQGALMRAKNDFDDGYSPEQVKLLNKGIYYTNDDWETVKAGLGHFMYYDPETGETKEDYGVIASTIIGKLILGENLKIYSESGKFEMGDDGLKVTAIEGEDNTDLFVVQKEKTDGSGQKYVEKYIYVDSDGEVKISGNSITLSGKPIIEYIDDAIEGIEIVGTNLVPLSKNLKSFTAENLTRSTVIYTDDSCTITNTYESGLIYTLSFQASDVSGTNINYGVGNRTPDQTASWNDITDGYKDVVNGSNVCTFTIPDTVTKVRIYFGAGSLNGTMTISNLKLETGDKATEWTPAIEDIQYAMKVATNYLSMDSTGIMVANMTDDNNNEYTPSNIETGKRNILITANDLRIRDGQNVLATYGNTITLGKSNGKNVVINSSGITLNDGNSALASYGDSVVIGRTTNPHIVLDSNSFNAYSANNKSYFSLGDGSTSSAESYAVPDNLASFTTTYPINTITSVKVGSTTISSSRYIYSSGDNKLFLLDVPTRNSTVSVTYTYSSDDEKASSNTQSFTVGAISLTIPLTVSNISIISVIVRSGTTSVNVTSDCDYNSSSNSIVFTNSTYVPPADSIVDVNYTINNTSPYFTFGTRNSSYAKGNGSASFASSGVASGVNSFTTGISNKSTGTASFTTGTGNTASGIYSFAEGRNNTASGSYAHAEGYGNTASNLYCHAEGYGNTVSGTYSHAEGRSNKSSGTYSHSEGYTNTASGAYSHVGGTSSIASGVTSFAHGEGLQASMKNAAAFGRYNEPLGFLFTVGNGTSSSARANAFAVGQGGNCYIGKRLISGTLSNNRKMFRTKEWSWDNLSIAANSTLGTHTSSIAIDYYTPIAISFIQLMNATTDGANSPNCNCYVCRFVDTNRNMLSFNIKNLGDSAAKIRVRVEILYMATAALG